MQETGKLPFGLTNDYMFRAAMQTSNAMLKGLAAALLCRDVEDITECIIENPIVLGKEITAKDIVMDLKILVNGREHINMEMQVRRHPAWEERTVIYLCRSVDDISVGEDYEKMKKTLHISILDFNLFPGSKDFYSEFYLMNKKTSQIYTDKIGMRVLELKKLKYADKKQQETSLYRWGRLLKAKTWEEIAMLAEKDKTMQDAGPTLKKLTADEEFQLLCEARKRYECDRTTLYQGGIREGVQQGVRKTQREMVRNMRKRGCSIKKICYLTGLPVKQVKAYCK